MVQFLDAAQTRDKMRSGQAKVLNVLSEQQFSEKHLPGSLNVPNDSPDFQQRVQQVLPDKSQPVIVHCSSNECPASTKAARKLEAMGYREVYDFKAGLQGWEDAG